MKLNSRSLVKRSAFGLAALLLTLLTANAALAQANLSMGLTVSPTSEEDAQGRITYTATVTNSGLGAADNLVLTFTIPNIELPISSTPSSCVYTNNGPLFATCALGTLAPGASATAIAVVYPTNVGDLFVTAVATETGGSTASAQVGSTLTGVGIAGVAVFLSATPNPAQVGLPLTYTVLAYNIGDDDAQNVVVSLVLPPGVTFISGTKPCTKSVNLVNCKVGHMVVSGSKTFNIVVQPSISGWTYATALLRGSTVADPSVLDNSAASRIWVNP